MGARATARPGARPGAGVGRLRLRHDTYATVFATACTGLITNLLLTLACLPFLAVLLAVAAGGGRASGLVLVLPAPLVAPALAAAFAVFAGFSADPTIPVARTFGTAWRRCARRALALGAASSAALAVLVVDVQVVWGRPVGAVAIPVLVTLVALVLATTVAALAALAERPQARLVVLLRVAGFLAVRRWYLTVPSLAVLALLADLVVTRPVPGLGLAAAPLLYLVWANSRYTLRPALDPASG